MLRAFACRRPPLRRRTRRAEVERIAREVLTNPVIEEYTYRIEE
ncbi:MAG: phosphoribosylformylglycinamidine synthase subunit PurS [Terracidiphilus sp.]